jgi:hypothetical protein
MVTGTNYTWKITQLECFSTDFVTNIIKKVHWDLSAKRGDNNTSCIGEVSFDEYDEENFLEYDSLTEEQVLFWTQDKLNQQQGENDVNTLKETLSEQLDALENKLSTPTLPWQIN